VSNGSLKKMQTVEGKLEYIPVERVTGEMDRAKMGRR
jgi:hypothetical protein